jgi:hypothetical protein
VLKAAAGGQESGNGELSLVGRCFFTLSGAKGLLFHVAPIRGKQVVRFAQTRNLRGPDRCFLRPGALSVALLELFSGIVQSRGIAAAFVLGHASPVESLGCGIAFGQRLDDVAEAPLGFIPLLPRKGRVSKSKLELGQKIVSGKEAFEAVALGPVRVKDDDRRRPLRAKALKGLGLLFNVDLHR